MGRSITGMVTDKCNTTFDEIKAEKKHRYVVFRIQNESEIDVELIAPRENGYEEFIQDMTAGGPNECRYGLFDYEYTHQVQGADGPSTKQKLFLMCWIPETANVRMKMTYATSFSSLKKSLIGVHHYIQATDASELSEEVVEAKIRSNDRV